MLRLPEGYKSRRANHRPSSPTSHQTKIYQLAGGLASSFFCRAVVDLGCSTGDKVAEYWSFQKWGYDLRPPKSGRYDKYFAVDLECCKDLENFNDMMIVCADVIEHLNNPVNLLRYLSRQVDRGNTVLISTPDRSRLQHHNTGPPRNPNHTREWSHHEFWGLLTDFRIPVVMEGHAIAHEEKGARMTSSYFVCRKRL